MTTTDEFSQPTSGEYIDMKDSVGRLLLFTPHEHVKEFVTQFGTKDVVRTDIVVLDGPDAGKEYTDCTVLQGALIGVLKQKVGGGKVLGRLAKGVAKPGQAAPYILEQFTDADAALARSYVEKQPKPAPW